MRWTNYHGHCEYCDGKGTIESYITKGIELGMPSLGISSHAPVPFPTDWTMPAYRLSEYIDEIKHYKEKYKNEIDVYTALEVDYIPDLISPTSKVIKDLDLDYTVGSVHFVGQFDDGEHWAIDGPADEFKRGLNEIFKGDIKRVVKRFYELQRDMIEHHTPTIIGHVDKIKMHNKSFGLFDESEQWYLDEVNSTLELIKQKGVIVEINTKAYYRDGHLFPGPEHFKKLQELNIPITINSDAHDPDKLLNGFEEVAELLLKAELSQVSVLDDGNWKSNNLSI